MPLFYVLDAITNQGLLYLKAESNAEIPSNKMHATSNLDYEVGKYSKSALVLHSGQALDSELRGLITSRNVYHALNSKFNELH